LSRQLVQRYRVMLEGKHLAPSTINQHLSAIRALADECAESGLLDQPTAAAVGRVKGVPVRGVRLGKWLTREAEQLLSTPPGTLMGLRDRNLGGGVCPHCHRTFLQLARHMRSKHPAAVDV
jgi:hypothetical protein